MNDQMQISLDTTIRTEVDNLNPQSIVIGTPADREKVSNTIRDVRYIKSRVTNFFKDMKENAHKTWKSICSLEKSYTDKCDIFEKAANTAILIFDEAEEKKRRAEEKRLQDIENEKAQKERDKLLADAEAAKKLAEDAEDSSPLIDRAQLLKEAESNELIAAQIEPPKIHVASIVTKQQGESVRVIWKARVINAALVPRAYLMVNETALDKQAKATQNTLPVPGVEFYEDKIIVRRNSN